MQDADSRSGPAATRNHAAASGSRAAAVEAGYGCWIWLDARVGTFPVAARRQMGHRLLDAVLDALTATVEAVSAGLIGPHFHRSGGDPGPGGRWVTGIRPS